MKFAIPLSLLLILSIISCDKDCQPGKLQFSVVGFSDEEADTIILRRFIKNNDAMPTLYDTLLIDKNEVQYSRSHDTLNMIYLAFELLLDPKYDYDVLFPGAPKLFRVADLLEDKSKSNNGTFSCTKESCVNPITGATVNGQLTPIARFQNLYLTR